MNPRGLLVLGALAAACTPTPEARTPRVPYAVAWARALQTGACDAVREPELRDSCLIALVERRGVERCGEIAAGAAQDECAFRLAETLRTPERCREAGRYAEDCALHVLSNTFLVDAPEARPGGPEEAALAERIGASGLPTDDPRAWTAWYRWALGRHAPLDRSACVNVAGEARRGICRAAGRGLYEDRLRHARDSGTLTCATPNDDPLLQHTADPELDALLVAYLPSCDTTNGTPQ